jgi:hypothetical protein
MKFLCLAYGDERDWQGLSKAAQEELLAQDEVLRTRGDLVAPVRPAQTLRVVNEEVHMTPGPFSHARLPLAGFSLIEAQDLDEAIALMSKTPCARANGAVEIWPVDEGGGSASR